MKNQYEQGQLDLIKQIKSQVLELENNSQGFDLVLDILSLLKEIKPIK